MRFVGLSLSLLLSHLSPHNSITFVGTGDPLQRGDIIVVLAHREGEDPHLGAETPEQWVRLPQYGHHERQKT